MRIFRENENTFKCYICEEEYPIEDLSDVREMKKNGYEIGGNKICKHCAKLFDKPLYESKKHLNEDASSDDVIYICSDRGRPETWPDVEETDAWGNRYGYTPCDYDDEDDCNYHNPENTYEEKEECWKDCIESLLHHDYVVVSYFEPKYDKWHREDYDIDDDDDEANEGEFEWLCDMNRLTKEEFEEQSKNNSEKKRFFCVTKDGKIIKERH